MLISLNPNPEKVAHITKNLFALVQSINSHS
jgi:hypothetical protein